jgi:multiple sugar transport system permease protein
VFTTTVQVVLAIALALFLNKKSRAVRAARTMIYLPVSISIVIACTVWNMFFSTSTGIFNTILETVGIPQQPFLTGKNQALYVIVFICCWKGVPYWMMFLLAGLQNISENIYEASRLDGAGYWVTLFKITLPMLKNSLVFVVIADTLINVFMFVPIYLLTGGGPSMSTDTLMYEAYRSAFSYGNYPRAYALVTVMMVIAIAIAAVQMFLTRDEKTTKVQPWRKRGDRA